MKISNSRQIAQSRSQTQAGFVIKMIGNIRSFGIESVIAAHRAVASLKRREDRMLMLLTSPPSATATSAPCPQCGEAMHIRLVVPHPATRTKERHTFGCEECGLVRTFMIELSARRTKPWGGKRPR
jgi:predicted RNA-binding Zn-ribbon protein involved in translation (DUF1610 family)